MLSSALMPLIGNLTLPTWLREILVSVCIAARTITVFAAAVAFGILVAIKIGEGNPWIAAAATVGVLLFVVLPVRLWWLGSRVDEYAHDGFRHVFHKDWL
jgi:hypothetical protein